jgi:UDPglucose 6-dehydrogenase
MQLQGASVVVTDPKAIENGRRVWPDITFVPTAQDAAQGADVVLLLTEWSEYRDLDPREFGSLVAHRRMLDGRNALDPAAWRSAGWTYRALGRP